MTGHRLMLRLIRPILICGLSVFFVIDCQKSYRVLSHSEIKSAYRSGDYRYIPRLIEVVNQENRDLANNAMLQLGNFYRDLAVQDDEDRSPEENRIYSDLENFFISNASANLDFNLKNMVYRNLSFSSHPKVWDLYESALSAPNSIGDGPERENAAAVIRFLKMRDEGDFDKVIPLCRKAVDKGVGNPDYELFSAGIKCLERFGEKSSDPAHRSTVMGILSEYEKRFRVNDWAHHYAVISLPLWQRQMEGGKKF